VEKLIFFLLDHWYIIAVILAVYYQISKGWKSVAKTSPPKRPAQMGMPPFGGRPGTAAGPQGAPAPADRPAHGNYTGAGQQAKQRALSRDSRDSHRTVALDDRESIRHAPRDAQESYRKASPLAPRDAGAAEIDPAATGPVEPLQLQPTPQQLAQGVAWAEILGPPRSKQPYRRR